MDNAIVETRAFDFDKMLLEQALQAETPDALAALIRMADQVGAGHMADVLEQRRRQLERPSLPAPVCRQAEGRHGLPAGCVLTERGVVVRSGGGRAVRQLADADYTWRWMRLASGRNVKTWNLPCLRATHRQADYESPAIDTSPTLWSSSCSGGAQ